MKKMQEEFKAEVFTLRNERKCLRMKSSPCQEKEDILQQIHMQKNTGFDNWLQGEKKNLLLYPTKQIADSFNQDKMQILKIRK